MKDFITGTAFAIVWNLIIVMQYLSYYATIAWFRVRRVQYSVKHTEVGPAAKRVL